MKNIFHIFSKNIKSLNTDTNISEDKQSIYLTDSPLINISQDKFQRKPFAKGISKIVTSLNNLESMVIGIYGNWGEGKSSVLNFIDNELSQHENIITVKFNPWNFNNETQIILQYFTILANALKASLKTKKERVGEIFKNYAEIFTLTDIPFLKSAIQRIGEKLSDTSLNDYKSRIEELLVNENKRVVIFIDDIDRLDKSEIQLIFKIIKQTANFKNTTYILAFDEEIVSSSLGERYAEGNKESGRDFLEKIIQIPLILPKVDEISLRNYCFQCIDELIKEFDITIPNDSVQIFVNSFIRGLEIGMKTPRIIKRYCNALAFALPILKNEINYSDLMLLEGIRTIYPKIYEFIRINKPMFLGMNFENDSYGRKYKEEAKVEIENTLNQYSPREKDSIIYLLKEMFPRLKSIFENTTYGNDWETEWAKEKRITSKSYIERYFFYTVPESDIPDVLIEQLLKQINSDSIEVISNKIKNIINERNSDAFILKLRRIERDLSEEISYKLAISISKISSKFPNPDNMYSFTTAFSQAAMLTAMLTKNILNNEKRIELASTILMEGEPILFSAEYFRWIKSYEKHQDSEKIISDEIIHELGVNLAKRINSYAISQYPIYKYLKQDSPYLFYIWKQWGSKEEVSKYLEETFQSNPSNVMDYITSFLGKSWSLETGIQLAHPLSRDEYELIIKNVSEDIIFKYLKEYYGSIIDDSQSQVNAKNNEPIQALAFQFANIYLTIKQNNQK